MAEKQTTILNTTKGNEFQSACLACNRNTWHIVLESVRQVRVTQEVEMEEMTETTATTDYEIMQCKGCESITFRDSTEFEVSWESGSGGSAGPEHVYPPRVIGRPGLTDTHELPGQICDIYWETHQALCNSQFILAGIGVRALIEALCNEKNACGANLKERVDHLVGLGTLTQEGATILQSLRILGNEAAHEVKAQSTEDLSTAFDVIEHLLLGVYLLPKKATGLQNKSGTR